jgi:hypothetical protein
MISARLIKHSIGALCFAAATLSASSAMAEIVTFDITWTSTGTAAATAELVLDTQYIVRDPNLYSKSFDIRYAKSFSMTVTGEPYGTALLPQFIFQSFTFFAPEGIVLSGELIGQRATPNTAPFGSGINGDFSLYSNERSAPTSIAPFEMRANQFQTSPDILVVSSIIAKPSVSAVPEPGTYAMLLAGLGLIGFTARRKQQ